MGKLNFLQLSLILIFLLSCSSQPQDIKYSDTLTIAVDVSIKEIKPFSSMELAGSLAELLYPPLFNLNSEGELEELLAERLLLEENGTKVRVFLKEVHADDVKGSFERVKELNLRKFQPVLSNLISIDVVSDKEVVFNLKRYDRFFLLNLSEINIAAFSKKDLTTGEFKIAKQTKDYVLFERKVPRPQHTNFIKVITMPTYHQAIKAAMKGEVDLILFLAQGGYEFLKTVSNLELKKLSTKHLYLILQNQTRSKDDLNLEAINQRIRKLNFSKSYGDVVSNKITIPVPIDSPWFDAALERELREQNLFQKFDNLNHEASLELAFANFQPRQEKLANFLKNNLKRNGIKIKLRPIPYNELYQKVFVEKDFDFFLGPLNFTDPFISASYFFHSSGAFNFSGYQNAKVDDYLDKTRYSQKFKAAKIYFNLAIKEIMKNPPGIFLFLADLSIIYRKGCINVPSNTAGLFIRLSEVRCPQVENKDVMTKANSDWRNSDW